MYNHSLWLFSPIFGEEIGVFLENHVIINILHRLAVLLAKNANVFANFKIYIYKIVKSIPGVDQQRHLASDRLRHRRHQRRPLHVAPVHHQDRRAGRLRQARALPTHARQLQVRYSNPARGSML
jgi:hypothetical protein